MIRDFKGRLYELLGVNAHYTHLRCVETGALVIVSNAHFTASGFVS